MHLTRTNKNPYGNFSILAPNGDLLCRVAERRFNWYLKKGLATQLNENTIRLDFEPEGSGAGRFATDPLQNICVVCGTTEDLTKHHVVPSCYRKHLPEAYKSHNMHDVVVACAPCHVDYERHADLLKAELNQSYVVSRLPVSAHWKAIRLASTLLEFDDHIPDHKKEVMRSRIETIMGEPVTDELIMSLAERHEDSKFSGTARSVDYTRLIADNDIQTFVKMWRQHFMDKAQPKFLPAYWDLDFVPQS